MFLSKIIYASSKLFLKMTFSLNENRFRIQESNSNQPFTMSIDHCFTLKGKGTILTGTVLSGSIKQDDFIQKVGHNFRKFEKKNLKNFLKLLTKLLSSITPRNIIRKEKNKINTSF